MDEAQPSDGHHKKATNGQGFIAATSIKFAGKGIVTVFVPCSWTTVSYHLTQFRDQVLLACLRSKLCGYSQTQLLLLRGQNLSEASESAAADIQSPRDQSAANENLVVSTCGIHCRYRNSVPKKKSPATPWNRRR
jgi:hypothetical protein